MNKKIFLTVTLVTILTCPVFADNEHANITNDNHGCTSGTLTVDSGSAILEADWQANRVAIAWYDGDTALSNVGNAAQCIYDGTLNLPTISPKPGYTFAGWKVRSNTSAPVQQIVNCSVYNDEECDLHPECIWYPREYECVIRVDTQYEFCDAESQEECENITTEVGSHPCEWDNRKNYCLLGGYSCDKVVNEDWCTTGAHCSWDSENGLCYFDD